MVNDPLPWLRSCKCQQYNCNHKQAADELEFLRAEVDRLTDALNNARTGVALLRCERLEAAGDHLVRLIFSSTIPSIDSLMDYLRSGIDEWEEARRG